MADQHLNPKRHLGGDNGPEQKLQKHERIEDDAASKTEAAEEAKSITDICHEMIERIFDYLDPAALLNTAQTCKRLQIAATAKFGDVYGNRKIHLHLIRFHNMGDSYYGVLTHPSVIDVIKLKFCLPFLRCFGAKISELAVFYNNATGLMQNNRFDGYINQYCADTLTDISLNNRPSMVKFPKPFKNLVKVVIPECKMGNQLSKFVNLFPSLRELTMHNYYIDNKSMTAVAIYFPNLEHLTVKGYENHAKVQFDSTNDGIAKLLHANPQLQSFAFDSYIYGLQLNKLLDMISGNPSISKLKSNRGIVDVNAVAIDRLASEHPIIEELVMVLFNFTANDAFMFIDKLSLLKRFYFQIKNRSECDRLLRQLNAIWKHEISNESGKDIMIELNLRTNN